MIQNTDLAGTVYSADLVEDHSKRGWTLFGLKSAVQLVWAAAFGGIEDVGRLQLVLTRVTDGAEVMRQDAGGYQEARELLQHVRTQLEELSVPDFEDRWTLT